MAPGDNLDREWADGAIPHGVSQQQLPNWPQRGRATCSDRPTPRPCARADPPHSQMPPEPGAFRPQKPTLNPEEPRRALPDSQEGPSRTRRGYLTLSSNMMAMSFT